MTVSIHLSDRQRTRELILSARGGIVTDQEAKTLDACLALATHIWVGEVRGEIVCSWGLVPPSLLAEEAYLWLYHTPKVEAYKFLFVRHSQLVMERMLEEYPKIVGVTDRNASSSIRWLRWLGAEFTDTGDDYIPFKIVGKHHG